MPFDTLNPLAPINIDAIISSNKLLEKAAAEGRDNFPSPEETVSIGDERLVDQIFKEMTTHYFDEASDIVLSRDKYISQGINEAMNAVNACHLLPDQFKHELSRELSQNRATIDVEFQRFKTAKTALRNFREKNGLLERNVVPLTKARIAFKIALLLLIITLEGAINAGLFATNMDGGLLSGFGIALLASALNAGVSFAFGLFLIPYINHKNALLKLGGWIAFACWIAITVVIAFAIAHYRDALQAGDTFEATKVAWTTFSEAPFTLTDFLSWLLWALTLFMGSCAAADGYTFRDPYPGYSKENTKYEEAKKRWDLFLARLQTGFGNLRQKYLKQIDELVAKASNEIISIKDNAQVKQKTLLEFDNACDNAVTTAQTLLQRMRSANVKERTEPAPAFYRDDRTFIFDTKINTSSLEEDNSRIKEVEEQVKATALKAPELHQKILKMNVNLDADQQAELLHALSETNA